jgi:hypothetical protein
MSAKADLAAIDHNDNHLQPGVKAIQKKGKLPDCLCVARLE